MSHMRKAILSALLALPVCIAAQFSWHWWMVARFVETTDNAYIQADISVVSPRVQGYVREVPAADNQLVKAGDILVKLDDRDYVTKVVEALARVQAQRAALRGIAGQVARQLAVADEAAAALASAQAEQRRAEQDYQRYRNLAHGEIASRQRLEAAQAEARKADAAVQKAQAAVAAEKDEILVLEAQRKQAEEVVSAAEAALEAARIDVDSTTIRAPLDGVIGNRSVQVGQLVKPGTQLLSVVPLSRVYVIANFKETQLARMRGGQKVELQVDAFPDRPVTGMVESFSPATGSLFSLLPPENATGNFVKIVQRLPVRIGLPPDNVLAGLLRPGLSVKVTIDTRGDGGTASSLGGVLGTAHAAPAMASR